SKRVMSAPDPKRTLRSSARLLSHSARWVCSHPPSQFRHTAGRPLVRHSRWRQTTLALRHSQRVRERTMSVTKIIWFAVLVVFSAVTAAGTEAFAQRRSGVRVEGQVQAGGGPLASSTVTLWAASAGEPKQLAQTKSGSDGRFELRAADSPSKDVVLYVVAKGGIATVNKGSGQSSHRI